MPAPIPPGFTRGPIVFIGALHSPQARQELLQTIWQEAGAYGGRLLVLAVEPALQPEVDGLVDLFTGWESDQVVGRMLARRRDALDPAPANQVEVATGIVVVGQDPLRLAATLGGTPLAQAIRRANARGKLVAGAGGAAIFLCQHMLVPEPGPVRSPARFAPGLGLVNRVVLEVPTALALDPSGDTLPLQAAVSLNPFLVGVGLAPDTAAVLYSDNTLQPYGLHATTVVDGAALEEVVPDLRPEKPQPIPGIQVHRLSTHHTFNLDDRTVRTVTAGDIPAGTGVF